MSDTQIKHETGGKFLVEPIGTSPVFSREQFSEEHQEIEKMVQEFAAEQILPHRETIEKFNKDICLQLLREMGELGLLGVDVPEEYGGMEMDKITTAIICEALSPGLSASFMAVWNVQTGIGTLPIAWFGTPEQKGKYLPKLVAGEWVGAYGLTEPEAGSDALSGKTQAVLSEDRKYYILNGEKIFITNGGWADVFTVFAQVDGNKFSAFIVDRDTPGFEIGPEEKKLGMKGSSTTSLVFNDAKVPVENLLYKVGQGATIAFNSLNMGRFKLGASDLGGCKTAITETVKYALERRQFGQSIAQFDAIKGKFADMIILTYTADSMIYRTIGLIQDEIDKLDKSDPDYYIHMGEAMERFAIEASMTKVYGSEAINIVNDHGVQILGGYGFIEDFIMAGVYRDNRIDRIWEGTNEINRMIINGYMMKKALIEELPIRDAIFEIDSFLKKDDSEFAKGPLHDEIYATETGKRLALYIFHEALNEYGQDLKHRQQLTEELANMFIDLYTADSNISRVLQIIESTGYNPVLVDIAKIHSAEVSIRMMNLALTGLNGIYRGHLPHKVIDMLREFQKRMLPKVDIIGLKREIADFVYKKQQYPF
ncbi:MAG: acyl-CoA dehydrogenase family protein [Candidatus Marinimicrobia bacterium]|nr:acyl-CoA dehydrogenase family protein [Candidatus Neomarinimicrobiota bacterium]MBL7047647.1 acyl-CoA dehydrogenase family protein [Candidatus Neomarinimicrobiota bacterium]